MIHETIIIIVIDDGNIERHLAGWKYCNFYYFYNIDFFNLYVFVCYNNFLAMSYKVMTQTCSSSFNVKWYVSFFYLVVTFYTHYKIIL